MNFAIKAINYQFYLKIKTKQLKDIYLYFFSYIRKLTVYYKNGLL